MDSPRYTARAAAQGCMMETVARGPLAAPIIYLTWRFDYSKFVGQPPAIDGWVEEAMTPKPRPLKLFADRSYFPPGGTLSPILQLFWDGRLIDPGNPEHDILDNLKTLGAELFELTSLDECDLAVYPARWQAGGRNEEAHRLAKSAQAAGKKTLIFFCDDSDELVPIEESIVYRPAINRRRRRPNERAMPACVKDYLAETSTGQLPLRHFQPQPTVGYCGYVAQARTPLYRLLYAAGASTRVDRALSRVGIRLIKAQAVRLRTQAVRILKRDPRLKTNFLLRSDSYNGALEGGRWNADLARRSRVEFYDNVLGSDYTLCLRGAGNYSIRFFQTLLCGRIPLFVDTDCVLPDEDVVRWDDHLIRVPEADLDSLAERLLAWHEAMDEAGFHARQEANRRLWVERFSVPGFFRVLSERLVRETTGAADPSGR